MSFWSQIKIIFIGGLILACSSVAQAKEFFVFEERRPVAMNNTEHPPKDIFINAGANDGLKVGMIVPLERHQTLYDMYKSNTLGDLVVKVGEIRLIHVQPDISVGRVVSVATYDDGPALDYAAIMIGDQADVSGAYMGKKVAMSNGPTGTATMASVATVSPQPVVSTPTPPAVAAVTATIAIAKAQTPTPNGGVPKTPPSSAPVALTP